MRAGSNFLMVLAVLLFAGCSSGTASETETAVVADAAACNCSKEGDGAIAAMEIPAKFQGQWNSECLGADEYDDGSLTISKEELLTAVGSKGMVKAAVHYADNQLGITAVMYGEGERWLSYRHFELSEDGKTLTDITDDESPFVRKKCEVTE